MSHRWDQQNRHYPPSQRHNPYNQTRGSGTRISWHRQVPITEAARPQVSSSSSSSQWGSGTPGSLLQPRKSNPQNRRPRILRQLSQSSPLGKKQSTSSTPTTPTGGKRRLTCTTDSRNLTESSIVSEGGLRNKTFAIVGQKKSLIQVSLAQNGYQPSTSSLPASQPRSTVDQQPLSVNSTQAQSTHNPVLQEALSPKPAPFLVLHSKTESTSVRQPLPKLHVEDLPAFQAEASPAPITPVDAKTQVASVSEVPESPLLARIVQIRTTCVQNQPIVEHIKAVKASPRRRTVSDCSLDQELKVGRKRGISECLYGERSEVVKGHGGKLMRIDSEEGGSVAKVPRIELENSSDRLRPSKKDSQELSVELDVCERTDEDANAPKEPEEESENLEVDVVGDTEFLSVDDTEIVGIFPLCTNSDRSQDRKEDSDCYETVHVTDIQEESPNFVVSDIASTDDNSNHASSVNKSSDYLGEKSVTKTEINPTTSHINVSEIDTETESETVRFNDASQDQLNLRFSPESEATTELVTNKDTTVQHSPKQNSDKSEDESEKAEPETMSGPNRSNSRSGMGSPFRSSSSQSHSRVAGPSSPFRSKGSGHQSPSHTSPFRGPSQRSPFRSPSRTLASPRRETVTVALFPSQPTTKDSPGKGRGEEGGLEEALRESESLWGQEEVTGRMAGMVVDDPDKDRNEKALESEETSPDTKEDIAEAKEDEPEVKLNEDNDDDVDDEELDIFSQNSFMDSQPRVDLSDDSDDDDLLEMDQVLYKELMEGSTRPVPTTPVKVEPPNEDSLNRSPFFKPKPPRSKHTKRESKPGKEGSSKDEAIDLDTLLEEHQRDEENRRELDEMDLVLLDDIKKGGMKNYTPAGNSGNEVTVKKEQEEMMPEHQNQIQQLMVNESSMHELPPGLQLFDYSQMGQVFTIPGNLTLQACGFEPGNSQMDRTLASIGPEQHLEFLLDDALLMMPAMKTPHAVLTWIFYTMSFHENSLVISGGFNILYTILTEDLLPGWVPSLLHIVRVLVNYGCPLEKLIPPSAPVQLSPDQIRFINPPADPQHQEPQELIRRHRGVPVENLQYVLQTTTYALKHRAKFYNPTELLTLTAVLSTAILEKQLLLEMILLDFQACISAVLYAVPDQQWHTWVGHLCCLLPRLSPHHHDKVHVVQQLPFENKRGVYLQRRAAFAMLISITSPDQDLQPQAVTSGFSISAIQNVLQGLDPSADFYQTSSIISLIDLAVGNEAILPQERTCLKELGEFLQSRMARIRERISMMDRTIVKDQMARLSGKWAFMLHNMSVQQTLFGWATKKTSTQVEEALDEEYADSDSTTSSSDDEADGDAPNTQSLSQGLLPELPAQA